MRIAHLIKITRISGAETHLLILLAALRRQGVDAHLILLVEPDKPMEDYVVQAQARAIPVERIIIGADWDVRVLGHVRRLLRDLRPDAVHTHLIHADLYGLVAAWMAGVRVRFSGRHNDDAFRRRPPVRWLNQRLWRWTTAGIAISQSIRHFAVEVEGAQPERVHVVEYGIEHQRMTDEQVRTAREALRQRLQLPANSLIVGMACRLTEQKGVTYALQACRDVLPQVADAHLVIAGEGELRAALEAEARQHQIAHRVHFMGWVPDARALMAGFDILLVPSLWEGFGLVLLEAMSRRVPVVASHVSAIPEVVAHGETGLLVPPRDVAALATALLSLMQDRALRFYMGQNGEDRLEQLFSDARMAREMITIYRRYLPASTHERT